MSINVNIMTCFLTPEVYNKWYHSLSERSNYYSKAICNLMAQL